MPYEIIIIEKPSEAKREEVIQELHELKAILEEYKDKTIEVDVKRVRKKNETIKTQQTKDKRKN